MYVYSLGQWLLFFFLYCFLGWVWESCYVSAKRRQWVNRGFLHGPMLPIYGTGAVIILLATIPVRDSLWLVFLLGMLAATALEYVTGAAMEALFKVRYWDYSKQSFNLNGYICLTSSLAWGAFSILLVRFLHPPVEDLVLRLPAFLVDPLAFLLTIAVTVDAVRSFQAAMDLREVLTRLTEENEDLRRLAKRVEVISAFAEEDLRRFRERTEVERLLRQERWEDTRRQIQEAYAKGARRRQAQLEESLRRRTDAKLTALANIQEALEAYRDRLAAARDLTEESLEARRAEVQQLLDRLRDRESSIRAFSSGSSGEVNGSLSIITSDSASPRTSTPSQKLLVATSSALPALTNCCSSWPLLVSPCSSTGSVMVARNCSARSRIMACEVHNIKQRPSLASISGLSIAARCRAAPGWFGRGRLRGTQSSAWC